MNEIPLEKYKQAYRRVVLEKQRRGFVVHATVYGVVNAFLIALNMLTVPQVTWFVFPLAGWGLGLALHYLGVRSVPKRLEEDEMKAEWMAQKGTEQA